MRLFIIFIFLTFVVLNITNAAPQSTPIRGSPIDDKSLVNSTDDDYLSTMDNPQFKIQLGFIGGDYGQSDLEATNYFLSAVKKSEISFERYFYWGLSLTTSQMIELKAQVDFGSLFMMDSLWESLGFGASHFILGQDGISNLVNINQTKFVLYGDITRYFQLQAYIGLKGLAYSASVQYWF